MFAIVFIAKKNTYKTKSMLKKITPQNINSNRSSERI